MKELIKFLFGKKWILVETLAGVWIEQQTGYLSSQEYCYYLIEYNEYLDEYRLRMEGRNPEKNRAYLSALQALQSYNKGEEFETFFETEIPKQQPILILHYPITEEKEFVMGKQNKNQDLLEKILVHKKELEGKGVEIYEEHDNILITSSGYYVSVYQSDFDPSEGDTKDITGE